MGKPGTKPASRAVPYLASVCLYFLFVWLWIDPTLLYYGDGSLSFPTFTFGLEFLRGALLRPGGPVEYVSAFLSQCYCYGWAGALTITLLAVLLGWLTNVFLSDTSGTRVPAAWAIPGLFLLVLCGNYAHKLGPLMGLLASLVSACAYVRLRRPGRLHSLAVFVCLALPLYYLAGGAYILFPLLCGVSELRRNGSLILFAGYFALAGLLPYVLGVRLMEVGPDEAYLRLTPFYTSSVPAGVRTPGRNTLLGLHLFLFASGVGGALWRRIPRAKGVSLDRSQATRADGPDSIGPSKATVLPRVTGPPPAPSLLRRLVRLGQRPASEFVAVIVAAAVTVALTSNATGSRSRRIIKQAILKQWPQVLDETRGLPAEALPYRFHNVVIRALYETGRLPHEMFSYPQHRAGYMLAWGETSRRAPALLPNAVSTGAEGLVREDVSKFSWYRLRLFYFEALGDLSLRLGLVNAAEHEAHEALEGLGDHPAILKRLALINITKGQTEAAKVCLRSLRKHLHHGRYADQILRRLQRDPQLATDPEIEAIRSVMIKTRSPTHFLQGFDELLSVNARNRMAYEYQMAFYLLNLVLADFVRQLDRLEDFGYLEVPRNYQEAIVVYESVTGEKVDLGGRKMDPRTRQAHEEFTKLLAAHARLSGGPGALEALRERFGGTYFYYFLRQAERMLSR